MIRVYDRIADIDAAAWNTLAGPHPGLQHAFLDALEQSGSVNAETGWQPCHLTLWDAEENGQLMGAMPLYRKAHSWGEYVFDWAWARAYEQQGLDYYPRLVSAVPFSPLPGNRLLARDDASRAALIKGAIELTRQLGDSSLHILFPTPEDARFANQHGMQLREQVQFHWQRDPAWTSFDDFLGSMSHDKRKKIKQERRYVREAGVTVERKAGADITEADWRFFIRCYQHTYREHRSTPYLNLDFFLRLHAAQPDACLLVLAYREGQPIAAAFDLVGPDALYGRYWGAVWDSAGFVPGLHFELCYYQGLEFALERGLNLFEGGAQGEHKLARGFMPVTTWSAHWLAHPAFRDAIGRFLRQERQAVDEWAEQLAAQHPFKKGESAG
ncbi:GNAT family N-acetyltransferase [Amantichitinum ursilacus]|uniref:FemAB family protein n=1 Tax=Amantichitinum ursilacus TaxID=857265 RepID=A0A0N1JRZ5_9NEIS|nr:GNAT family N-acetyltransferase [Amantichitinum ursilacus]KPC50438.1 hypothetical protein WG78_17560 [Amantichitinum ursilacus]